MLILVLVLVLVLVGLVLVLILVLVTQSLKKSLTYEVCNELLTHISVF